MYGGSPSNISKIMIPKAQISTDVVYEFPLISSGDFQYSVPTTVFLLPELPGEWPRFASFTLPSLDNNTLSDLIFPLICPISWNRTRTSKIYSCWQTELLRFCDAKVILWHHKTVWSCLPTIHIHIYKCKQFQLHSDEIPHIFPKYPWDIPPPSILSRSTPHELFFLVYPQGCFLLDIMIGN